jgi:hypothetical protein
MSKSVRIPDRSYEKVDELRQLGYESLTNVLALAIDRFYEAEMPRGTTMEHLTESELRQMIHEYLGNGDFEISDYAACEFAGLTAMLAQDWPEERLESVGRNIESRDDYDGLGTYAYELAKGMGLEPGYDYRP